MPADHDPRVYFAAERTLLAWVRTGLTVIGLGFVVARFGLFLRMLRPLDVPEDNGSSTVIGVSLILIGSLAVGVAAWQHARFSRQLAEGERPRRYFMGWSVWFALTLSAVGVLLALFLVLRSKPH